jgi:integrase
MAMKEWGTSALSDIKAMAVESWLGTLKLANGTRAKIRNIMSALYSLAMRWEFFDRNPITMVRQSAKRGRTPEVLTADELKAELAGVYRVMVFVAATTGLRVSELLGLRWLDCDFEDGEIHLTRGIVRQHETDMKTEASRKPVPMEMGLADLLKIWRMECVYSQPSDCIFASADMDGKTTPVAKQRDGRPPPASGHSSRNNQTFGLAYASPYVRYFAEG